MRLSTLVGSPWLPVDSSTTLFGRQVVDLAHVDDAALGHVHEAQLARDLQVLLHAAADHRRLASELVRRAHHLAQSADVRGERRHQHPPRRLRDELLERFAHARLRRRPAGLLDAHAVAQQHQHALVAELAQALVVGRLALDGRRIELEVAGVEDRADRRADDQPDRVRDAVVDRDRLDFEGAEGRRAGPREIGCWMTRPSMPCSLSLTEIRPSVSGVP